MEVWFRGKTPQLKHNKAGLNTPAWQLSESYKFQLISSNLNNKCLGYNV